MATKKPAWTAEEESQLAELLDVGASAAQIAGVILRRSVAAIRARRLRICGAQMKTWRTWTPKEEARLEEMRMAGKTVKEIAAELGRTFASVNGRLSTLDVARAPRRWEQWLEAFSDGAPDRVVAERMGVGLYAVKQRKLRLRKAGFDIVHVRRNQHGVSWQSRPRDVD